MQPDYHGAPLVEPESLSKLSHLSGQFTPMGGDHFDPMPSNRGESKLWTPEQKGLVAVNYAEGYIQTPKHLRNVGKEFYPSWQTDAGYVGDVAGIGLAGGAALMASLSPSNEAELNRIQAIQLAHGLTGAQMRHVRNSAELTSQATSARTRARTKGISHSEKQSLISEADSLQAESEAARARAKFGDSPLNAVGSRHIAHGLDIMEGKYEDPLQSLKGGPQGNHELKLWDFGNTIHDPMWGRQVVDTHFHDAGVHRFNIPYDPTKKQIAAGWNKRGLSATGRYSAFQQSAEMARQHVRNLTGVDVAPSDFMAGIWYGHQQRKLEANPGSRSSRKASATKLANAKERESWKPWLPENHGLRESIVRLDI